MTDKPTKAAHTRGPVEASSSIYEHMCAEIRCIEPGRERGIAQVWQHQNGFADATLIAEAFNVATETGMTPRQIAYQLEMANKLLETANNAIRAANKKNDGLKVRRAELLALLDEAATAIEEEVSAGDDDHPIIRAHRETAEKVRAAIAKAGAA